MPNPNCEWQLDGIRNLLFVWSYNQNWNQISSQMFVLIENHIGTVILYVLFAWFNKTLALSPFSLFWIKIWYNVQEAIWVTNIWSLDMNKQTNYQQQLSDGRNVLCRKKRRRKIICQVKLNRWPKMRSNRKYSTGVYGFTRYYSSNLFYFGKC